MPHFFLILSDYKCFNKGSLLKYENNKLTDVNNKGSLDYSGEIEKEWIELSPDYIKELTEMNPEDRLCISTEKSMDKYKALYQLCSSDKITESSITNSQIMRNSVPVLDNPSIDDVVNSADENHKKEDCNCKKYNKDEYVKFIDGAQRNVGQVQSCYLKNGQHYLQLKRITSNLVENKVPIEDVSIHDGNVVKKGLKNITKYYDGVLIDPSSIFLMKESEYKFLKVGDKVEVRLRDSCEIYKGNVTWLGEVNNTAVAAVESTIQLRDQNVGNLICCGTFEDKKYFENGAYIFPLSVIRKILQEDLVSVARIREITYSLSQKNVTEDLHTNLKYILDNIGIFRVIPSDFIINFLTFSNDLLRNFKRDFIHKKMEEQSKNLQPELDENAKLLLKCSTIVLNIMLYLCSQYDSVVTEVSNNYSLMEKLDLIFMKLKSNIGLLGEIRDIVTSIILIYWNILKNGKKKSDVWLSWMTDVFNGCKTDADITLIAALNMSFLIDTSYDDVSKVIDCLKQSLQKDSEKVSKNDIILALGKIISLFDFPVAKEKATSNTQECDEYNENSSYQETEKYLEIEHCGKPADELIDHEYEKCIKLLIIDDKSKESIGYLLRNICKLKDQEIFPIFIEKLETIEFNTFSQEIFQLCYCEKWCQTILDKCTIEESDFPFLVTITHCLLNDKKVANIGFILRKIDNSNDSLDCKLLSLASTAWLDGHTDICNTALSKCKNVDLLFDNEEAFVTYIIKRCYDEDKIIKTIEEWKFNINVYNAANESPIQLARKKQLQKVFEYIGTLSPNINDLYSQN